MTRLKGFLTVCIAALCAFYCSHHPSNLPPDDPDVTYMQGSEVQGRSLFGFPGAVTTTYDFLFGSATRNDAALSNVHIEDGELVAEQNQASLHGSDLVGTHLYAEVRDTSVTPPATTMVEYQITGVQAESASYDPTGTGNSFLYTLKQNVDGAGNWQTACPADADGQTVAIPLTATWDEHGNRVASSTQFTFGCTTGVIAKCYRWGYRPWVTGYGDLVSTHWACTRMARADYCGTGKPNTHEGTPIYLWDNLPSPGPIWSQGTTPLLVVFEAGWDTNGAVCLSHARWVLGGELIAAACPGRLIAPGLGVLNATVCDTTAQALGQAADASMFNASNLNLNLDLF
jgi:hypothetical protein